MSRTVARGAFLFALAFTALGLSGCQFVDSVITPAFMPTIAEEAELGRQFRPEIEKDLVFVNDPEILQYVRGLGAKVVANAPEKSEFEATFYVVKDPSLNAFAIPGGNIYVHTGLLYAAEDEAEVMGVLAHEYGHVVYRHSAKHLSRSQGYNVLQELILGEAGAVGVLAGQVVASGVLNKHGRDDELQADSIAIPTLYAAGLDPNGIVSFFQKLKDTYGEKTGLIQTYSASHPATGERIERAKGQIALLPPNAMQRPINDLRRIQARLEDLGLEPPPAETPPAAPAAK